MMGVIAEERVSISEAAQNFSNVVRLVDEAGTVIILKDDLPRYVMLSYDLFRRDAVAPDADADAAASRILSKHIKAFEELAK